jgi:hypothetical protein
MSALAKSETATIKSLLPWRKTPIWTLTRVRLRRGFKIVRKDQLGRDLHMRTKDSSAMRQKQFTLITKHILMRVLLGRCISGLALSVHFLVLISTVLHTLHKAQKR